MIGERIKKARHLVGITQEDLSSLIGKARQTVVRWESGVRSPNSEDICPPPEHNPAISGRG